MSATYDPATGPFPDPATGSPDSAGSPSAPAASSLDLGPTPWAPSQPAPRYVGGTPDPGYFPGANPYQPAPQYAPPTPQYAPPASQYGGPAPTVSYASDPAPTPGYEVYDGTMSQPAALQPYAYQFQPSAPLTPGQVVQTPYGTFVVGDKSRMAAGLLGIFLGGFGVGQFYRGNIGLGIAQIFANIACGAGALWGFVEGILVLVAKPGAPLSLDSNGRIMI